MTTDHGQQEFGQSRFVAGAAGGQGQDHRAAAAAAEVESAVRRTIFLFNVSCVSKGQKLKFLCKSYCKIVSQIKLPMQS